jgi:hypothetical protein
MLMSSLFKLKDLPKLAGLIALYVLMAKLTLLLFGSNTVAEFLWPSTGFALAVVLIGGNKYLPAVFLGCSLGHLLIGEPLFFSLAMALGHTAPRPASASSLAGRRVYWLRDSWPRSLFSFHSHHARIARRLRCVPAHATGGPGSRSCQLGPCARPS